MMTRLYSSVIFTIFVVSSLVSAQQQPNVAPVTDAMKTRFENTVEYANCKLAQYSVQSTKDAVLKADFMKNCNCNPDGGTDANLKRFFNVHKMGKNAKIFAMTDSLKLAYQPGKTGAELAGIITGYFASNKLVDFASNKPNFPDFTKQISSEIDNRFIGTANTATPPATSGQTAVSPDPIQAATETSESAFTKFIYYFIVFLLGVLAGAIGLRFWQQSKAKERRTTNPDGSATAANSPDTSVLEQQITMLQRELENQKKLNTQLKMRLDDAFSTRTAEPTRPAASYVTPPIDDDFDIQTNAPNIVEFDDENEEDDEPTIVNTGIHHIDFEVETTIPPLVTTIQPEPQTTQPRIFFLRLPTVDGLFNDLRKSDVFRPADSVYRMEMIDATHASFAIVPDEETMQRAIQGFKMYLEPACDLVGDINTNATIIRTLEEGTAVKEGDVWRIIEKALIDLA